jgi:hypothetical protein
MTIPSPEASTSAPAGVVPVDPGRRVWRRGLLVHFVIVVVVVSGAAATFSGPTAALSAALGVGLAGVNLWLMHRMMGALTLTGGASTAWAVALPFKLLALVASAYALVRLGLAEPVPLAIGFALLPLTGVFLPGASSVPALVIPSRSAPPGQLR